MIGSFEQRNEKESTTYDEKNMLFHQEAVRTSMRKTAKFNELNYKRFHHYLYSSDLCPYDNSLFSKFKW